MIRVLIVEDEPPIARALVQCIEQLSDSFEVVGMVINGKMALERLSSDPVDVIFTDIRMPVMNGIALLKQVSDLYPDIITVVLSGYQDFSYAQSALRYGAFDYILKPISKEGIASLLKELEKKFNHKMKENKRSDMLRVLRGEIPRITGIADCTVLVLCAGAFPVLPDDSMVPGKAFWNSVKLEEIVSSLVNGQESVLVFDGRTTTEKLIAIESSHTMNVKQLADELYSTLTAMCKIHITLVGSQESIPIALVGDTISTLRSLLYTEIRICKSQIIWYSGEDYKSEGRKTRRLGEFPINKTVEAICLQDNEQLCNAIQEAISLAGEEGLRQLEFSQFLDGVINDSRLSGGNHTESIADIKLDINEAISNSVSLEDLHLNISSVLITLGQATLRGDNKKVLDTVVQQVEDYLIQNYGKSISNEMLARKFGFVPSYISKIFRKSKGMSPSEFLTRYRVNMAKQILCGQPDLRIRDVAKRVGYDDQYYFSKIFKKETGIWPKQFQESCQEGNISGDDFNRLSV